MKLFFVFIIQGKMDVDEIESYTIAKHLRENHPTSLWGNSSPKQVLEGRIPHLREAFPQPDSCWNRQSSIWKIYRRVEHTTASAREREREPVRHKHIHTSKSANTHTITTISQTLTNKTLQSGEHDRQSHELKIKF